MPPSKTREIAARVVAGGLRLNHGRNLDGRAVQENVVCAQVAGEVVFTPL